MVELAAGAEPRSIPKRSAPSAEPQLQRLFKHFTHVIHSFADTLLQRDVSFQSTCLWAIHDTPRNEVTVVAQGAAALACRDNH